MADTAFREKYQSIKISKIKFRYTALRATLRRHPTTRLGKLMRADNLEKVLKTRPSILCVTHQMSRKKRNYSVG